ncbi:alpha/beta fold hydrolase [Halioglobus maricola]|uniref:Alpha/beta fold hydrolase n=1 Tax=Halioglobus maricola TaxID=2601894 RepID=A0A5P9NP00_9GAMM|nr:haloalkane dehalogenase [Halioglobus maricola]QFU76638.1 alpha/beta fold hydrolase [Halioglobus maricola]
MQARRTPDERFDNLPGYPFNPNYLQVDDTEGGELRIHYLDEGAPDGDVVLLLHGQPAWSYLYRHMIPPLVAAGFRVIAPDLVGFGRSDKPVRLEDYTYARHVAWMSDWLAQLDLTGITVFLQDWGSLIGLRLVAAFPERFSGVVLSNGGLPAGPIPDEFAGPARETYKTLPVVKAAELEACFRGNYEGGPPGVPGFLYWRKFCAESPEIVRPGDPIDLIGNAAPLTELEKEAFNAPYPDESYLAGARRFPSLVPLFADEPEVAENKIAWKVLKQFDKPFLCAFADDDPVTAGMEQPFLDSVPGCQGVDHRTIGPAGHFPQQDQPEQCVKAILDVTGR